MLGLLAIGARSETAGPHRSCGLVGADDDAGGGGLRAGQPEFSGRCRVGEQPLSLSQQNGKHQQDQLVGKALLDQDRGEGGAAPDDEIWTFASFDLAQALDDVGAKALCRPLHQTVRPARGDKFSGAIEALRHGIGFAGPMGCEDVIGSPAQQQI